MEDALQLILRSARQGRLSAFAGAAISYDSPSLAPSWYSFRDEIIRALAQNLVDGSSSPFQRSFETLLHSALRPEIFLEGIDRFGRGMSQVVAFAQRVHSGSPNMSHFAIAALASSKHLNHIVTTNWDSYIEDALAVLGSSDDILSIQDGRAIDSASKRSNVILHLHGAVRNSGFVQAGLYRIGFGLSPEVRTFLAEILRRNDCLFLGFSGSDWDVHSVLTDVLPDSRNQLFWLYRKTGGLSDNVKILIKSFPGKVIPIESDLPSFLQWICGKLGVAVVSPGPDTRVVPNTILKDAVADFGACQATLTFAFACAALGMWDAASSWCEYAEDLAFSSELYRDSRGEVYRLSSGIAACAQMFDMAEHLLSRARYEYNQTPMGAVGRMKIETLLRLHRGLIELCRCHFKPAENLFWEALKVLQAEKTLSNLRVSSGSEFPMLNGWAASLYGTTQALVSPDITEAVIIHQNVVMHHVRNRNIWGYLSSLLSIALCYFRGERIEEARMALEDCLHESRETGLAVHSDAAAHNLELLAGKESSQANATSPIVDPQTGWHLVPDPFSVVIRFSAGGL